MTCSGHCLEHERQTTLNIRENDVNIQIDLAVHSDVYLGSKQVQGAFEMKLFLLHSNLHEMTVAIAGETLVEASS
jgi:hypothetical protein